MMPLMGAVKKHAFRRAAIGVVVVLACSQAAHAGPLGVAIAGMADVLKEIAANISTILGPVMTLIGGGRAAWKASHGEAFTTPLIQAIVGVAIFGVAAL